MADSGIPFLWKGAGEHTGKGLVMLPPGFSGQVFIAGPDGKPIQYLSKDTTRHVPEPGDPAPGTPVDFGTKFLAPKWGGDYGSNFLIGITSGGKTQYVNIKDGSAEFRGHINEGEGTLSKPAEVPQIGPSSGTGIPGGFQPGQIGQFGVFPAYLGGMFPSAKLAQFNPTFTDPMKFAKSFGSFNRNEIQKNFNLSSDLALKELNTELSSLQNFVPAASALKRSETSIDNQFNQQQRTAQVNQVLPHAAGDLEAQRQRANSYAGGNIPDSVQNSAFELGIRSAAADRAAGGGFGATSSVARKSSDLLSAQERVGLSKYGDQLLGQNLNASANLFLAPTEYSNAGGQVNVNPSLSASQLINSNLNAINGFATIPATTALGSTTQQNQYNASNQFAASQFNAGQQNQFALSQFGYNAGFANSVAGAAQTNINTNFGLQQQQMFNQLMQSYLSQSQDTGLTNSLSQLGGMLLFGTKGSGIFDSLTGKGGGKNGGGSFTGSLADAANTIGTGGGDILSGITDSVGGLF